MTVQTTRIPLRATTAGLRRFTVAEYHKLAELGLLTEDDNLELLEGYLVHKMTRNPPHDATIQKAMKKLLRTLPSGWDLRIRSAVTLPQSEPEPDLTVVRGDETFYVARHPGPADMGLVVEVADSTLLSDRADKGRIYAGAGIPCYWIINLLDQQIEVYTTPSGPTPSPTYAQREDRRPGDQVALVLDGVSVANLFVQDLLP